MHIKQPYFRYKLKHPHIQSHIHFMGKDEGNDHGRKGAENAPANGFGETSCV